MSEAITFKKTLVAVAAAAVAGGTLAAELGSLTVFSAVGQALDAELTIRDVDAQADKIMVRLAPESTYRRVGKKVGVPLSDLTLTLLRKDPYTVKIAGKEAVGVDKFPLIVELNDGGKVSAKLYEIRLQAQPAAPMTKPGSASESPAVTAAQTSPAAPTKPQVPAASTKPAASMEPSAVPSRQTAPKATPEPTYVPPVREPVTQQEKAPVQKAAAAVKPAVKPAAKPTAKASAETPVKLPLNPADYDLDKPFLVRDGMTMWSIATLYRPRYPHASMDQILVAFVRANPSAYERGRVSGVKVGSRLKAPLTDEVAAVGIDEAWALVRLAPNADARKAPSAKLLARAHARMPKQAPALWRQYKAQQPKAPVIKSEPKAEPVKTPEPVKVPEAAAPTQTPAAAAPAGTAAATAGADPLAGTIAQAEADHNAKINAAQQPAAETSSSSAPAAETTASNEPAAESTPVPAMPALTEEEEGSSDGFWGTLLGILVVLAGAAGGVWYRMRTRAASERRREDNMGVIKFRKTQAADAEQLKGASEMVERRLESERATERMQQAQKQAEHARIEPTLGAVKPQTPQTEPLKPTEQPAAADETAEQSVKPQAPSSGLDVAAAYVGDEPAPSAAEVAPSAPVAPAAPTGDLSTEALAGKLVTARTYIGVGAYAEAKRVLHEVMIVGNQEQRRQAAELLAQIERLTNQ